MIGIGLMTEALGFGVAVTAPDMLGKVILGGGAIATGAYAIAQGIKGPPKSGNN
jgi:hypothetical protein